MIANISLEQMRDVYIQIRDLTSEYLSNPTAEGFPELMDTRSRMLSTISAHKRIPLNGTRNDPVVDEIRGCIETILELDKQAAQCANEIMSGIKSELSSLSKSGKAAKAYTANCR